MILRGPDGILFGLQRANELFLILVLIEGDLVEKVGQIFIFEEGFTVHPVTVVEIHHLVFLQKISHAIGDTLENLAFWSVVLHEKLHRMVMRVEVRQNVVVLGNCQGHKFET